MDFGKGNTMAFQNSGGAQLIDLRGLVKNYQAGGGEVAVLRTST
jgi:hypothetical protein